MKTKVTDSVNTIVDDEDNTTQKATLSRPRNQLNDEEESNKATKKQKVIPETETRKSVLETLEELGANKEALEYVSQWITSIEVEPKMRRYTDDSDGEITDEEDYDMYCPYALFKIHLNEEGMNALFKPNPRPHKSGCGGRGLGKIVQYFEIDETNNSEIWVRVYAFTAPWKKYKDVYYDLGKDVVMSANEESLTVHREHFNELCQSLIFKHDKKEGKEMDYEDADDECEETEEDREEESSFIKFLIQEKEVIANRLLLSMLFDFRQLENYKSKFSISE